MLPSTAGGVAAVPWEVWTQILLLLPADEIVRVRKVRIEAHQTSRALYRAGTSADLWRRLCADLRQHTPLLPLPLGGEGGMRYALEYCALHAQRLASRWTAPMARPGAVVRFQAHANRITALALASAPPHGSGLAQRSTHAMQAPTWLVTGSVDGYVRLWHVHKALAHPALDILGEYDDGPRQREGPLDDDTKDAVLAAEVDTGDDVTALAVHYSAHKVRIAVGSYYSGAGCQVYEFDTRTSVLQLCASLHPQEWCGTQSVALCDDAVAVGTYPGQIYLLDLRTHTQTLFARPGRDSIAALHMDPAHLVVLTRTGSREVYARAERPCQEVSPATDAPLVLVQKEVLSSRPWVSTAITAAPSSILVMDQGGVSHYMHETARSTSVLHQRIELAQERLIGTALGASARRGLVVSCFGGLPPVCTVRGYTSTPDGGCVTMLQPTPDVGTARRLPHASPPARVDMLTESVLDEAQGLVCLASVRGAVWIADYGAQRTPGSCTPSGQRS